MPIMKIEIQESMVVEAVAYQESPKCFLERTLRSASAKPFPKPSKIPRNTSSMISFHPPTQFLLARDERDSPDENNGYNHDNEDSSAFEFIATRKERDKIQSVNGLELFCEVFWISPKARH